MTRVLVVDDEKEILERVEEALAAAGLEVLATSDPEEAVTLSEIQPPDAAVLDETLPGVTGYDVLSALRSRPGARDLPIVLLSERTDSANRALALQEGVDDYVLKPFNPSELAARVRRLLGGFRERAVLEGDLEVFELTEVLQGLGHAGRSGVLTLSGGPPAWIRLRSGQVSAATFGSLRGEEAALAILDQRRGRFAFCLETSGEPADGEGEGLSVQGLLMEAVWLQDELAMQRDHVPDDDAPLRASHSAQGPPGSRHRSLPLQELHLTCREHPGTTLRDLLAQSRAAPARVRLAVAWLLEHGDLVVA